MTYEEAKNSKLPFNRKKYDGWYYADFRGVDCSCTDLSQRFWTKKDLEASDWIIKPLTPFIEIVDENKQEL